MNRNSQQRQYCMADGAYGSGAIPLINASASGWLHRSVRRPSNTELNLRLEERQKERARIARDLHDTVFQGFLGASMVLHRAVEEMPADSPSKPALNRALLLIRRVIDEGRLALDGLRSSPAPARSLEQALAALVDEVSAEGPRFRMSVMGRSKALDPAIEKEIYLIVREALVNALRHSAATNIETDLEYLSSALRVVVRDNGLGMDQEVLRAGRASHWGLLGMRERAASIGARLQIRSRRGAGTEVEISVPTSSIAVRGALEEKICGLGTPSTESAVS